MDPKMDRHVTPPHPQRLREIAQELGVVSNADLPSLSPPRHVPTFRVPDDDRKADAVLGQLKIELSQDQSRPKGLKRKFSLVKPATNYSYEEIYAALSRVIEENGLPGVAEVLLGRFKGLGGDTNFSRRASTGLIKKFRNTDIPEQRGHLLELAVENGCVEIVQLLVPDADQSSLNESLTVALEKRELALLEVLFQYGVNLADHQEVFQNAVGNEDIELVQLMLRAPNRLPEHCVARALIQAVTSGSLPMVTLLLRAGANCDHDGGAALVRAVEACRIDIVTALVTTAKVPAYTLVDEALHTAISAPTSNWSDVYPLAEVLLCAGPIGDAINEGLLKATVLSNIQMMQLFLRHQADINYNGACAVANAMQRNRTDLVGMLLQQQDLKPETASELVGRIPLSASPTERIASLSKLLVYGASGVHCNEQLIIAVTQNDLETAQLLIGYGRAQNLPPIVSVDYEGARSLQTAVSQGNIEMVKILALDGQPSEVFLSKAFSSIPKLGINEHFIMVQTLLRAGAKGPEVDNALRMAIAAPEKPKRLIDLLIQYSSHVDDNTLFLSVSQGNADIIQALFSREIRTPACSAALSLAMKLPMSQHRFRIAKLLLDHRVEGDAGSEVAQAVVHLVHNCPGDIKLLRLLCHEGKANINFDCGLAVVLATRYSDPIILDIVLRSAGEPPNASTITRALQCAIDLPITDLHRHHKVETILRGVKPQQAMDDALVQEIESSLSVQRDNSVIEILLSNGADVNAHEAASICHAVRDPTILDLVLTRRPTPQSLALAFPLAMAISEPERTTVCEKLLRAGAVGEEISKALCAAVKEGRGSMPLIKLLLPQADINYKEGRPLRLATRQVFTDGLDILLVPRPVMPSVPTKIGVLTEAMKLKGKQDRYDVMKRLLEIKIPTLALSDALIIATNTSDPALVELLLSHGASVNHESGQAIRSAASSGQTEILKSLVDGKLASKPSLSTLTSGFGGAMILKENDGDTYHATLEILLSAGMRGEPVHAALLEAVREGDSNVEMTKMIYNNGASAEWQEGKALDIAAQTACIETMKVLLGKKLSQPTLSRAYSSALTLPREERYQAVQLLLEAGKEIDKPVVNTLIHAVRDSALNFEFIELLLKHNVFDDGASMIFAAKNFDIEGLTLLLGSPKATQHLSKAFRAAMSTPAFWTSDKSLAIAEILLEHGASGELVGDALIDTVERYQDSSDSFTTTFLDILLRCGADVNHKHGLVLQYAAQKVDASLIQKLLPNATSNSKAMAIPYLFKNSSDKSTILKVLQEFNESDVDEDRALDISFKHPDPDLQPVLFMALNSFPRRTQILRALLDIGYSPNQWGMYEIDTEIGNEPWSALCWAISQPEKKISSANIELLIDEGADVNFKSKSGITPLMLSIENQRPDILSKLISKGAKVTVSDEQGVTPLAFASQMGNTKMMEHLLAAGAEIDDGSLHDAAGDLRCDAMRVLVKYGHDVDYPSERHDGRSALAEVCLNAVDKGTKQDLEDAVRFLLASDADFKIKGVSEKHSGKSIIHYALDSSDPVTILQVLLKLPLWKFINEECFLFQDETYTYSLTKYVEKDLFSGPQAQKDEILRLLRTKRATDRFWATSLDATQPEDICGAPSHIEEEMLRQKARQKRLLEQREDAMAMVALKRDTIIEEGKVMIIQTNQEIKRTMEKSRAEVHLMEIKADTELRLSTRAENERQRLLRNTQQSEVSHLKSLGAVQASNARAIRHAEIEEDATRNLMELEYNEKRINRENDGLRSRLAIENSAREDQEKASMRQHERELVRMRLQRSVLDKSSTLAGQLQASGMNQRQIGYVVGEV
ncbi:hypothetical protein BP5796_03470 [Coleophoma crateriformis]|uniref:Ankyrin repeat containing protein n=1 Tax=Coleophoma crateriformis TaxID=565419 RepID=A0A3D8SNB9_9HELO|nr:hypothetical protein BP5796_03470 [Coleophoma crateriformis]